MRKTRCLALLLLLGTALSELIAQDPRAAVQATLARLAPGKRLPDDLILTGQLTDSYGVFPFRITIKGKDQARYDVGVGAARVIMTISKGSGWRETGGKIEVLQPYSAMQRPVLVPFLDLLAEADTPALQVTDRGAFTIGPASSRRYTLKLPDSVPARLRLYGRTLDEETDFYVDPVSAVVLRSERSRMAENSMLVRFRVITEFSDYRNVQGFAIPFRIAETVTAPSRPAAQAVYVVQSVTLNSGVPDSTFTPTEPKR